MKKNVQLYKSCNLFFWVIVCIFMCWTGAGTTFSGSGILPASDRNEIYLDEAGAQALQLWAEREIERTLSNASRCYWDFWLYNYGHRYGFHPSRRHFKYFGSSLRDPRGCPGFIRPPFLLHYQPIQIFIGFPYPESSAYSPLSGSRCKEDCPSGCHEDCGTK